jgi:hypothetical protein
MAKKSKKDVVIIHTKDSNVILEPGEYWMQEFAAVELDTTPGNIRSHVHMHYLGTQINRMNLLSKDDLEFIRSRLRKKK